jgi:hypothetical protein
MAMSVLWGVIPLVSRNLEFAVSEFEPDSVKSNRIGHLGVQEIDGMLRFREARPELFQKIALKQ